MPSPPTNPVAGLARLLAGGLLDLLYPPVCVLCGQMGAAPLCAVCRAQWKPVPAPVCGACAAALPPSGQCARCAAEPLASLSAVRAAGCYEGRLREAICALKYRKRTSLAAPLAEFLAEYLLAHSAWLASVEVIVPVPLHPSRMRARGFNQAELIAHAVSRRTGIPMAPNALFRIRNTRPQVRLRASERAANVSGAFGRPSVQALAHRHVLLVDDVVTTLHTLEECASVALGAGAKSVKACGVARDN